MKYAIRIDQTTLTSAVHAETCTARNGAARKSLTVYREADSAEAAAAQFTADEELIERQLPATKVCACCKSPKL